MFILIEIDNDWTVGIDWRKHCKGIRLGYFAIHWFNMKYKDYMGTVSEGYHQERLKRMKQ
ncbi:hypothetical protein [Evansella clarkii]|uniref:hypothetical protein n=1 Tax=Evansella clarkii TaxID=79879 RepID=UPI000998CCFF|nr:hypothetical protein [Evansella clarkii]